MNVQQGISLANISLAAVPPRLRLIVIQEPDDKSIANLIVRLALGGPFHLISCGHWLPDQDAMLETARRYTLAVEETLNNLIIGRPANCSRLQNQLEQAEKQPNAILILNFLHPFFDPDIEAPLRQRILERCCLSLKSLSQSKPVTILVRKMASEEYQNFFESVTSVADEILEVEEEPTPEASKSALMREAMGTDTLSVTGLAHKLIGELEPLLELLSVNGRPILKKYFEIILEERNAIAKATDLLPFEVALLVLLVRDHEWNNRENDKLYKQIDELRKELAEFKDKT